MTAKLADYMIQGGTAGFERLKVLARVMQDPTAAWLDRIGVAEGFRCLDVGCGTGDVSFELASRVGSEGRVLGADLDHLKLELARRDSEAEGFGEIVEFRCLDVTELPETEQFDLVYARFLLADLKDPGAMLAKFRRLLRPGGLLVVEDIDFSGYFCYPPSDSHGRYVDLYVRAAQAKGSDPLIGQRLPGLLAGAGFSEIQVDVVQPMAVRGEAKLISPITMKNIAESVISTQLSTPTEVEGLLADLLALAERPDTLMGMPRVVQVCGRAG